MDLSSTDAANIDYSDHHPVLLAASSDAAMARAEGPIISAGFRVGGRLPIDGAWDRIAHQAGTSAVWIELDQDGGGPMDELLNEISREVADGRYCAVVSGTSELLDPLTAAIRDDAIDLLIDPSDAERAAALAVAFTLKDGAGHLADIGGDKNAERLRQLSEEVSRIASTLARLSTGPVVVPTGVDRPPAEGAPALPADVVRNVIRARRLRTRYFASELFADPAWDMLLDLLQAEIAQLRVPVSRPMHRGRCAGHNGIAMVENDGLPRIAHSQGRPARRPPCLRRTFPGRQPTAEALFRGSRRRRSELAAPCRERLAVAVARRAGG